MAKQVSSQKNSYSHNNIERKAWLDVSDILSSHNKTVVFLTAPSIRVALGEEFGIESGVNCIESIIGALKELGASFVFDVAFGADLTVMEEASELVERLKNNVNLPMFTSCCPAWVKFCEMYYPELIANLSTTKSPISMQASIIKTYFAKKMNLKLSDIVVVALTPCTAKKAEILRPELSDASKFMNQKYVQDCDFVLTTRELAEWFKEKNIDLNVIAKQDFDSMFGLASGAGYIFGNSGGVMEATLRTAYYLITGQKASEEFFELEAIRGLEDIKEATVKIEDFELNVAVVSGLKSVRHFLSTLNSGKHFHFVEVMTCKGGCIGGAGQPKHLASVNNTLRKKRVEGLYLADNKATVRSSYENTQIKTLYDEFLERPLSKTSNKLLHTSYTSKKKLLGEKASKYKIKT